MSNGAKIGWAAAILIVIALGWWAFTNKGSNQAVQQTGPIKIGVIGPFTGDAAVYGEPLQKTIQLAVDQANAAGGVDGRQVQAIFEDGKCDSTAAVNAANKLIQTDGVQAIIGGFCSGETIPVVPIAEQAKVFLFSPSASSPKLTGISTFFARDYPSDSKQGEVLATLAQSKGYKNIAFIQEQTDYAAGLYQAFDTSFTASGGKTENQQFPSNATDFRSALVSLKSAKPDALFIDTQTPATADRVAKQLRELGWKPQIFLSDVTMGDPKTLAADKDLFEGAYGAQFVPDETNPKLKQLEADYKAKYGVDLPYVGYMSCGYDAVNLLLQGAATVGYDGAKLAAWSRTIQNWPGATGSITIGQNGDRVSGHVPQVVKNGVAVNLPQ